jgi:ABC-type transporter Mla subunit MlaD
VLNPLSPLLRLAAGAGRTVGAVRRIRRTLTTVPSALEAVLVLPTLADHLERVASNTDHLPTLSAQLDRVVANTDRLSLVAAHTERLAANTATLPETQTELIAMRAAIVRMHADTSSMAGDVSRLVSLEHAVPALAPMLADVESTVRRLAEVAEPLQGAAMRFGRLADRLPNRGGALNGRAPVSPRSGG